MIVKIIDYGQKTNQNFVKYSVTQLTQNQLNFLENNLDEDIEINDDKLIVTLYFEDKLYPFQSELSKHRLEDYLAREEIEMNLFLSSFLDDNCFIL